MRNDRVDWLTSDIADMFPHIAKTYTSGPGPKVYHTLYVGRSPFPETAMNAPMNDKIRCEQLTMQGLRCRLVTIPSEKDIVNSLSLLIHGIGAFSQSV
jgi:hypothetical protein